MELKLKLELRGNGIEIGLEIARGPMESEPDDSRRCKDSLRVTGDSTFVSDNLLDDTDRVMEVEVEVEAAAEAEVETEMEVGEELEEFPAGALVLVVCFCVVVCCRC